MKLPSLKDRTDIVELATNYLSRIDDSWVLTESAIDALLNYSWPGNIRELHSILMQATFLADGNKIYPEHLQFEEENKCVSNQEQAYSLKEVERKAIEQVLSIAKGNMTNTAKLLQIGRNTLYRKLAEHGIDY